MSFFFEPAMACWTAMSCPDEYQFELCTDGCRREDYFSAEKWGADIICNECMPHSHHVMFRNNKVCVHEDMFYDCTPQTNNKTNMTMPQGPEHCRKCFMMGTEVGCTDCDDGMYLDTASGMCMKKEDKHYEAPEWRTNVEPCGSEM
jgi:hypothetical protein